MDSDDVGKLILKEWEERAVPKGLQPSLKQILFGETQQGIDPRICGSYTRQSLSIFYEQFQFW